MLFFCVLALLFSLGAFPVAPYAAEAGPVTETPLPATAPDGASPPDETPPPLPDEDAATLEALFTAIQNRAEQRATRSWRNPAGQIPGFMLNMDFAAWEHIRFKQEYSPWAGEGLPFTLDFFAPGSIYDRAVAVNLIENGTIRRLAFSGDMFDFGPDFPLEQLAAEADVDFAGFSLSFRPPWPAEPQELASFLGATYFRSCGQHAEYGLSGRGLALNTALPDGEEFPYFREFWLVKPTPDATSFILFAQMESPGMTGACQFVITPGSAAVMEVRCRLFKRQSAALPQKIGLAAMNSMFLAGEDAAVVAEPAPAAAPAGPVGPATAADPLTMSSPAETHGNEVHSSDGLLLRQEDGTWSWRPLQNPARLEVSTFAAVSPGGFGLMQRDADPNQYRTGAVAYNRQTSLWVEPLEDWGRGHIELVEIPTRSDMHSNIYAYWVPSPDDSPVNEALSREDREEQETSAPPLPLQRFFSYRLYWMDAGLTPHLLGRVTASRVVLAEGGDSARFVLDFDGEELRSLPADTGLTSIVETPEEAPLLEKSLMKDPRTGRWQLTFTVRLHRREGVMQTIIAAREGAPRLRFRAHLKRGENIPAPLTETWVHDLTLP